MGQPVVFVTERRNGMTVEARYVSISFWLQGPLMRQELVVIISCPDLVASWEIVPHSQRTYKLLYDLHRSSDCPSVVNSTRIPIRQGHHGPALCSHRAAMIFGEDHRVEETSEHSAEIEDTNTAEWSAGKGCFGHG